jgi:small conductance mechanosensitive channel
MENIQQIIAKLTAMGTDFGVKLIAALAIFIIGRWVAIGIKNLIDKGLFKNNIDFLLHFWHDAEYGKNRPNAH